MATFHNSIIISVTTAQCKLMKIGNVGLMKEWQVQLVSK